MSAAASSEILVRICCTCRKEKKVRAAGKGNPMTGGKDQFRCDDCNMTRNKLYRLSVNDAELAAGIKGFTDEERRKLYEEAEGLWGDRLKKLVTHSVCISQSRKMTFTLDASAPLQDKEEAKARILAKPDGQAEWDTIMKNTTEITNEVTGRQMIWIPQYTLSKKQEDSMTMEKKRRIEGEETVRPKAKAKGKAKAKAKTELGQGEERQPQPKALATSVKDRLVKSIPKLQAVLTKIATVVAEAGAEDMKKNIPERQLTRATTIQDNLDEQLKALQKFHDEQVGEPPAIKAAFSNANTTQKDAVDMVKRLRVYMDDAGDEEAEEQQEAGD